MTEGKELYDDQGKYARHGKVNEFVLKKLMEHPYLRREIPKSAGQEQFGYELYRDIRKQASIKSREDAYDLVRTLTEFTVRSIANEIRKRLPSDPPVKTLYASGGGAENTFIMHRLQELLPGIHIEKFDLPGIDSGIKEAFGFSYLGYLFLRGLPGNVPSVTGASRKAVLGKIVYPG
ncbi:MAG: anhydro-N-acetylmuramic acid kinase [Candidatus Marinimicrobia bacterium]|nr:anhydro-N-acetylmuramic acid kinase [Candidatus Neomarinimicrobiota bacterium]